VRHSHQTWQYTLSVNSCPQYIQSYVHHALSAVLNRSFAMTSVSRSSPANRGYKRGHSCRRKLKSPRSTSLTNIRPDYSSPSCVSTATVLRFPFAISMPRCVYVLGLVMALRAHEPQAHRPLAKCCRMRGIRPQPRRLQHGRPDISRLCQTQVSACACAGLYCDIAIRLYADSYSFTTWVISAPEAACRRRTCVLRPFSGFLGNDVGASALFQCHLRPAAPRVYLVSTLPCYRMYA
jgi:hypothetical protein